MRLLFVSHHDTNAPSLTVSLSSLSLALLFLSLLALSFSSFSFSLSLGHFLSLAGASAMCRLARPCHPGPLREHVRDATADCVSVPCCCHNYEVFYGVIMGQRPGYYYQRAPPLREDGQVRCFAVASAV